MKTFFIITTMFMITSLNYVQAQDIKHIPSHDQSQSITESTPVVISEDEILVFYASENKDTIYSTRTTDGGLIW